MGRQALAEAVQRIDRSGAVGGQAVGELADGDVIAEDRQHEWMVRVAVLGVARQQRLLLQAEVLAPCAVQNVRNAARASPAVCSVARRSFWATKSA